jgi:hypothetical protein
MFAPIHAAALVLPLLNPSLPATATQLRSHPIPISGVVCTSPRDMAGLYRINLKGIAKNADELLALGRESGLRCMLLKNTLVFNWGPVAGPEGTIEVAGSKPVSIVHVVDCTDKAGPEKHYFLIAKSR